VINDDCVRVAHFLHDLIDNRDHSGSCLLTKDELCALYQVCDSGVAVFLVCIQMCF